MSGPAMARAATVLGLLPLALIAWDASTGGLGAEPVEALMRRTGYWALTLLVFTLAVTPIRKITGWNRLIAVRRPLGLLAFLYASLHLLNYIVIDQWFGWEYIIEDILERPLITAGFTALLLLIPLALTSTKSSIRRLGGKRWQRIHRLIYPAALLGVLHYYWLVKADKTGPLIYAAVVIVLLTLRIWNPFTRRHRRSASSPESRPAEAPAGAR